MNARKLTDRRGNLVAVNPNHDDPKRIRQLIGRLTVLEISLPGARSTIDERIRDCVDAQGQGGGSGISDTVARAAAQITVHQHQHRQLGTALKSVEEAVAHLVNTVAMVNQSQAAVIADPVRRCPAMELRDQTVRVSSGTIADQVLMRCDRLTAHKLDEKGNPIDYDPDDFCDDHRAKANEEARRSDVELKRRQRRRGAA